MIVDKILQKKHTTIIIFPCYSPEEGYAIFINTNCDPGHKRNLWTSVFNEHLEIVPYHHSTTPKIHKTERVCIQIVKKHFKNLYKVPKRHNLYVRYTPCVLFVKPN